MKLVACLGPQVGKGDQHVIARYVGGVDVVADRPLQPGRRHVCGAFTDLGAEHRRLTNRQGVTAQDMGGTIVGLVVNPDVAAAIELCHVSRAHCIGAAL
ncbi:hypothetical protein PFLU3_57230 [Pseudomonas fluorescens]|uniref:Uncharacterized protein n=1 Tax=Pseudomonas fluorescens TaxID=294 RepID=A0A0D0SNM2_PSEFL|nr:hypothetical protein PFLU3_57230 [Pseudomonas fluorescens]